MATFERGFDDVANAAATAASAASTLVAAVRQLQKAAGEGDIGRMRKGIERLSVLRDAVQQGLANARNAWGFTPEEEQAYLETQYEQELVELARSVGLNVSQQDRRLVAYPVIVRVLAAERAVRIDRKKVTRLRPSRLVTDLKALQTKKPKLTSERFLETLHRGYRLLVGKSERGKTVALARIYEAVTLLPGVAAEYDRIDFCRDLFLLDRSGLRHTRSGAEFTLPASTGTKGGRAFSFIAPDGEYVTYYGIRFAEAGQ